MITRRPIAPHISTNISFAVVGARNFLDPAVDLCRMAGYSATLSSHKTYRQALRWLLSREYRQSTMLYIRGGGGIRYILGAKATGKPVIKHWIGSDAHRLVAGAVFAREMQIWIHKHWVACHLAVSQELADKLKAVNIVVSGIVRTITGITRAEVEPLPCRFTVLSYWTPGRREFYGGDMILELAREYPEIRFLIVGNDGEGSPAPSNVEYLGYRTDMPNIYRQSSVLIRMPKTDGAANMPLEMLARGRYVIYNKPLEGCCLARSIDEVRRALMELRQLGSPNVEGARRVKEMYALEKEADRFRTCVETWLRKHRSGCS